MGGGIHRWRQSQHFAHHHGFFECVVFDANGLAWSHTSELRTDQIDIRDQIINRRNSRDLESLHHFLTISDRSVIGVSRQLQNNSRDGRRNPCLLQRPLTGFKIVQCVFVGRAGKEKGFLGNQSPFKELLSTIQFLFRCFKMSLCRFKTRSQSSVFTSDLRHQRAFCDIGSFRNSFARFEPN